MDNESLFRTEEKTVQEALNLLKTVSSRDPQWASNYEKLLTSYRKLLSNTQRLIKVSDLMQNDLAALNDQLDSANRLQAQLLATAATGIIVTDLDGVVTRVSDSFCLTTGFGTEEVVGAGWSEVCGGSAGQDFLSQVISDGPVFRREFSIVTKQGHTLDTLVNAARLTDGLGRPVGAVFSFVDVTELTEARKGAEAADQAKSRFLASMSHEMRTPLTGILGFTEILLEEEMTRDQKEAVNAIKTSGDTLLSFMNDILDLSKIEADRFEFESIPFSLENVVLVACEITRPAAEKKDVEILCDLKDAPPQLVGDPTRMQQVLTNLLSNAIKFTDRGEILTTVRAIAESGDLVKVQISVCDTGIGIPDDKVEHIFKSFAQADGSITRKYGGTGLGLAITSKLVRLMGGDIEVKSRVGEGSTFEVRMWLKKAPTDHCKPIWINMVSEFSGRTVLLIDDNPTSLRILSDMLTSLGIENVSSEDVGEAEAALKSRRFDMVFLDAEMPWGDGPEFAQILREYRKPSPPQLIALTSRLLQVPAGKVNGRAFDGYLMKPISRLTLIYLLRSFWGRLEDEHTRGVGSSGQEPPNRRLTILLVEDDPVSRMVAERVFKKMGHEIEVAEDGEAAVNIVRSKRYDLIFMDMQMPRMDGLSATRAIRRLGVEAPIVAMTAAAMKGDRELCLSAGMDGYISKPFKRDAIVDILNQYCGAHTDEVTL
jgi:two-component system, sensor histidine kinase and response regulator